MQFLLDYAEERVRPLAGEAMSLSGVQGIVLEPDPVWLYWLALTDYAGRTRARHLFERIPWHLLGRYNLPAISEPLYQGYLWLRGLMSQIFTGPQDVPLMRPLSLDDLKDLPEGWDEYRQQGGWPKEARDPIVVNVRLRPDLAPRERSRLTDLPLINTLRVVFETHPVAVFYASPRTRTVPLIGGVSVGVSTLHDGTLGGILRDGSRYYGITCSHVVPNDLDVVEQPAKVDSSASATRIGERIIGTTLVSSKISDPCNAYTSTTPINTLDVAVVEIDKNTNVKNPPEIRKLGPMLSIVPRNVLNAGQQVEFSGKESGHKRRLLRGVGVPYRVADSVSGNIHCFQHLLVFRTSNNRRPSKQGDSGAWLCIQYGHGLGWAGMIIGGDSHDGFAIFADGVEQWWKSKGLALSL